MRKFQIDPNTQFIIGLLITVLAVFSKGSVAMPLGIPPIVEQYIDSWSNFLLFLYAPVATYMAAYSSSNPGWAAPPDPPIVKAAMDKAAAGIMRVFLIGIFLASSLIVFSDSKAEAATLKVTHKYAACGKGGCQPTPVNPVPVPINGGLSLNGINVWVSSDIEKAITRANAHNPSDVAAAECLGKTQSLVAELDGAPLTGNLADDFEKAWLFHEDLNTLKEDSNCRDMCSRPALLFPILGKIAPNICDAVNLLR